MSAISSVGGGTPVARPIIVTTSNSKPTNATTTAPKSSGNDRDHDGDTDGAGLDVKG